jgi:hypothetical protein
MATIAEHANLISRGACPACAELMRHRHVPQVGPAKWNTGHLKTEGIVPHLAPPSSISVQRDTPKMFLLFRLETRRIERM